ncbi:hypothetical protein SNE40_013183 [Patella caerulea]|uniref:Uncharacterized protein n=1 Tax=Patella caerulea TaxID=87958 RepID=A0AAN8JQY6_PATCE
MESRKTSAASDKFDLAGVIFSNEGGKTPLSGKNLAKNLKKSTPKTGSSDKSKTGSSDKSKKLENLEDSSDIECSGMVKDTAVDKLSHPEPPSFEFSMVDMMSKMTSAITKSVEQIAKVQLNMRDDPKTFLTFILTDNRAGLDSAHAQVSMTSANSQNDEQDDIRDQIDKVLNETSTHEVTNVTDNANEDTADLLDNLQQLYSEELNTGPEINPDVAKIFSSLLEQKIPEEKISKTEESFNVPKNCSFLITPKVNTEIWTKLSPHVRSADIKLQKIQTRLTNGLIPITVVLDKLNETRKSKENFKHDDLQDIIRQLFDAFALLSSAHFELSMKRRDIIKPDLNPAVRGQLCSTSNKITSNLFGDDLPQNIKEIHEVNRVGQKLQKNKVYGNRQSPYPNQSRYQYRSPLSSNDGASSNNSGTTTPKAYTNQSKNWAAKKGNQVKKKFPNQRQ